MDLQTQYLGLSLRNPLVASASPLSRDVGQVRYMEDAGLAAVVVFSLFEEEIHHGELTPEHYRRPNGGDVMGYFPDHARYETGPDAYLTHIEHLKEAVDIPIIGSLNGSTPGGWTEHARQIETAGADALELNLYHLPVAVKLGPYFSATANMAHRLDQAGVDGLVLFNCFYQPDIDLDRLEPYPARRALHALRPAPASALDRHSARSRQSPSGPYGRGPITRRSSRRSWSAPRSP